MQVVLVIQVDRSKLNQIPWPFGLKLVSDVRELCSTQTEILYTHVCNCNVCSAKGCDQG